MLTANVSTIDVALADGFRSEGSRRALPETLNTHGLQNDIVLLYTNNSWGWQAAQYGLAMLLSSAHRSPTRVLDSALQMNSGEFRSLLATLVQDAFMTTPYSAFGGAPMKRHRMQQPVDSLEWFRVAHSTRESLSMSELGVIVDGLTGALVSAEFSVVDQALSTAQLAKMSLDAIVAFARLPFMAQHKLACWTAFIGRASVEIVARGGNPKRVLAGLM